MTFWSAISFIGGSGVLIAAIAWLIRSMLQFLINKDLESFKANLSKASALELERFKHELSIKFREQEILREKRVDIIEDLYSKLIKFLGAVESFVSLFEMGGEPSKDEKRKIVEGAAQEFQKFFLEKKIYFSEALCEQVSNCFQEAWQPTVSFSIAHRRNPSGIASNGRDAWDEAYTAVSEKIPPLQKEIQKELRRLIGVEGNDR